MSKKISWRLEIDALSESIQFGWDRDRLSSPQKPTEAQLVLNWSSRGSSSGAPAQLELRWCSAGAPLELPMPPKISKKNNHKKWQSLEKILARSFWNMMNFHFLRSPRKWFFFSTHIFFSKKVHFFVSTWWITVRCWRAETRTKFSSQSRIFYDWSVD